MRNLVDVILGDTIKAEGGEVRKLGGVQVDAFPVERNDVVEGFNAVNVCDVGYRATAA